MTEPEFPELKKAMEEVQRFAQSWAAQITEAFKPFNEAVERMQKPRCKHGGDPEKCS